MTPWCARHAKTWCGSPSGYLQWNAAPDGSDGKHIPPLLFSSLLVFLMLQSWLLSTTHPLSNFPYLSGVPSLSTPCRNFLPKHSHTSTRLLLSVSVECLHSLSPWGNMILEDVVWEDMPGIYVDWKERRREKRSEATCVNLQMCV